MRRLPSRRAFETLAQKRIDEAMARGEFDNLPGEGKPFAWAGGVYDPDWWLKDTLRREKLVSGMSPEARETLRRMFRSGR